MCFSIHNAAMHLEMRTGTVVTRVVAAAVARAAELAAMVVEWDRVLARLRMQC